MTPFDSPNMIRLRFRSKQFYQLHLQPFGRRFETFIGLLSSHAFGKTSSVHPSLCKCRATIKKLKQVIDLIDEYGKSTALQCPLPHVLQTAQT
jgi:hypothetical protein